MGYVLGRYTSCMDGYLNGWGPGAEIVINFFNGIGGLSAADRILWGGEGYVCRISVSEIGVGFLRKGR